jgi:hypothetical protein
MVPFTNCCAHTHPMSYSFKLQFYVHPEDRWYPEYRDPRTSLASTSTETLSNAGSGLPVTDAHVQADEPTDASAASSSSVETSPGLTDRPSTPAATEHADSRPTTPRQQQLGDGFSVVPGPSRRLQRERPFSVAPDPMWNSSREIQPDERLATQAPPPPYVLPPSYAEMVPPGQIDAVHPEPLPVEVIEIDPSAFSRAASEDEAADIGGSGSDANPKNDESQLSEKARGKKRMREEDENENDDSELGGDCSSGSSSGTRTSDRDGQPDRKRLKTGRDTTDTRFSTDRLEGVDDEILIAARAGLVETLTDVESFRQVKKLKEIEKLHRIARRLS